MKRFRPTSHTFISLRTKLNYVDWGNRDAPLLLLVHGMRDHSRSWDWAAAELAAQWHVVAPDLRGHGDSAWSQSGCYDIPSFVIDLAQLVFELGNKPVAIIGHSLGAHVALRFAAIYPELVRKLVSMEAVGLPADLENERVGPPIEVRFRRWIDDLRAASVRQHRRYENLEQAVQRMQVENAWMSHEQARHIALHGSRRNGDGSYCWKFDNFLNLWPFLDIPQDDVVALWNRVRCPVLLMYGRDSWSSPLADELLATMSAAKLVRVKEAGHWIHHEQLQCFLEEVRDFLW